MLKPLTSKDSLNSIIYFVFSEGKLVDPIENKNVTFNCENVVTYKKIAIKTSWLVNLLQAISKSTYF